LTEGVALPGSFRYQSGFVFERGGSRSRVEEIPESARAIYLMRR
jgi:hypothetical protein